MDYLNNSTHHQHEKNAPVKNTDAEERYRCLFEQATDLIVIHHLDGTIIDVNESICKRLGYSREELLQMNFTNLVDPLQLREAPLRMTELAAGKLVFSERRYVCKDGSFVEIEANVKKMSNNLVLVVCRDVTERRKMERELREAELKFRTISEKSLVGIYIIQDGKFAYVNPKFAEILGYLPEELIEHCDVETVIDEADREMARENIRLRMEGKAESTHYELRGRKKDGTLIYAEVYGSRSLYKGRDAIIGTLIDITERKKSAEQVLRERNLSNEIIDCLPGVFFLQDEQGRYLRWNKLFGKETGYAHEEIKDLNALDFFEGTQRDEVQQKIREVFADPNGETDLETEIVARDGRKIPFYFKGKHIQYEGRRCIIGTGIDITELKKVEGELKKSEANLQTMFANTDTVYVLLDKEQRIVSYNQRAVDFVARELHHTMRVSDYFIDYFTPNRRKALTGWMTRAAEGEHISYEISYPKPDESPTWYYVRMFPIANESREILGIMCAVSDITERKLTEQRLQRSIEQLTYHINNTPLAVIEWDKDVHVKQWSRRAEEIFGWTAEEALGKDMNQYIVYPDDATKVRDLVEDLRFGRLNQNPHQNRNTTRDGKLLYCEWYNSLMRDEDGNVETILSLVRDVTEIRTAEEELRRSFREISDYKIALDESSIVGITDPAGIFTYVNDNLCRASGFSKEELLGHDHSMLQTGADPGEYIKEKWDRISSGKVWRGELRNRTKCGGSFWVDMTIIPFLDETGKPLQYMYISNDITQRKEMEAAILAQKVEEQKKITRAVIKAQEKERNKIGQELHDNVNQILASSRMFLSVALNGQMGNREALRESTALIDTAIQEIRMLSRNQITPQGKLGLKELIQLLVDNLNEHASINTRFDYKVADHDIDTDLKLNIYRIIQEQVNNILKHAHATQVNICLNSDGKFIDVSVTDDGKGFQPFKKKSGVGLTNIINRVESFNGEFSIKSSYGKGCRLSIRVPI